MAPQIAQRILCYAGALEMLVGVFLLILLAVSLYDPHTFLKNHLGVPSSSIGLLGGNSWAQTAVAFGMHGYADVFNGYEQIMLMSRGVAPLPKTVSVWNTTRFFISFLWLLVLATGLYQMSPEAAKKFDFPIVTQILLCVLAFDALLLRPVAVFCQRAVDDASPAERGQEEKEWKSFSPLQRFCRCVFYYEAVLSGTSGLAYMVAPQLFPWLFGFSPKHSTEMVFWSLSQFGACVSAFGLYQMSADIDTRTGHVAWWLFLDFVWLYVFWQGITLVHGPWNPLLLRGGNLFTHLAFHADSTLALARTVFLVTLYVRGRDGISGVLSVRGAAKKKKSASTSESDDTSDSAPTPRRAASKGKKAH